MASGIKGITFAVALDILERAKKQIEREMRRQAAVAPKDVAFIEISKVTPQYRLTFSNITFGTV